MSLLSCLCGGFGCNARGRNRRSLLDQDVRMRRVNMCGCGDSRSCGCNDDCGCSCNCNDDCCCG